MSPWVGNFHLEYLINPYIWCAVGGLVGWLAGLLMKSSGTVLLLENIAVAVFGAFIGGDFIAAQLNKGIINDQDFSIRSLGIAIAGAVVMLLLLRLMRGGVGALQHSKPKSRNRN